MTEFLDDEVRLGHTKRGSFVFTVVTRLGDPLPVHDDNGERAVAFPRKVMETLAHGLETTRDLTQKWNRLRSLNLSFEWVAAEPRPEVGRSPIVVDRDVIAGLPRVRECLVQASCTKSR